MLEFPHRLAGEAASAVLSLALNAFLAPQLNDSQRERLQGRVVAIGVPQARPQCRVRWNGRAFAPVPGDWPADVAICAGLGDYVRLLRREVDADGLFFERRLRLEGDTELGLAIKNMLDALDSPGMAASKILRRKVFRGR